MERWAKIGTTVGIILIIIMICIGIYFTWFYNPLPYDAIFDMQRANMGVNKTEEDIIDELKEKKVEEVKREPTAKEIIREIERNKPRFNLTIESNLVVEDKEYIELKEANLERVVDKLKPNDEIYPKTIELTEEDIKRLQEYDTSKVGSYIGFDNYDKERARGWIEKINPIGFPTYKNAKVEWLTDLNLVYKTAIGQTGIRGILRIQYFEEDNRFKLEPNKIYELDTEFIVSNTVNYDNSISMKLNEILYLSNLKEVE